MNRIRKSLGCLAIVATMANAALFAQDPPTPVTAPSPVAATTETVTSSLGRILAWVDENAIVSSGVGSTLGGASGFGVLLKQSVVLYRHEFARASIGLGLDHASLFADDPNYNHEQVGLSLNWRLVNTPLLQQSKEGTPVLRKLPLNLSELMISPYIGVDIDRAVQGTFEGKATVVGVTLGWKL